MRNEFTHQEYVSNTITFLLDIGFMAYEFEFVAKNLPKMCRCGVRRRDSSIPVGAVINIEVIRFAFNAKNSTTLSLLSRPVEVRAGDRCLQARASCICDKNVNISDGDVVSVRRLKKSFNSDYPSCRSVNECENQMGPGCFSYLPSFFPAS